MLWNHKSNLTDISGATRFLYLGENVRPTYTYFDYSLSFDLDTYHDRNIYLPLWLLRTESYAIPNSDYEVIETSSLTSSKVLSTNSNKVCYIGNNHVPNRIEAIGILKEYGFEVDTFGSQSNPIHSKHQTLQNYRYTLCFENSYYPGYITEKLFDTFSAGTIPIYWGFSSHLPLNPHSFYTCQPNISLQESISNLREWDREYIYDNSLPPIFKKDYLDNLHHKVELPLSKVLYKLFVA